MSVAGLKAVVENVGRLEEQEGAIQPWSEIASTQSVIPEGDMPTPGEILPDIREFSYLGAKEITLANGMKVRACDVVVVFASRDMCLAPDFCRLCSSRCLSCTNNRVAA